VRRARQTGSRLHVGFVDEHGEEVAAQDALSVRTAAHPRQSAAGW
jgi:hypothetical protein